MFDPKSDYALNKKDQEAIVYPSATGVHIRLTREDFASDEEFRFWKDFSDDDYKDIESAGRSYYDNCIPLTDTLKSTGLSAEGAFFAPLLKAEQKEQKIALLQQVKDVLTKTQYHRLWLYYVQSMTMEEIAAVENVAHQNISKSIRAAQKKIKNFFGSVEVGCKKVLFTVIGERRISPLPFKHLEN